MNFYLSNNGEAQLIERLTLQQQEALGLSETHLVDVVQQDHIFKMHFQMQKSFESLQCEAQKEGFKLQLVSSFRGFSRQKTIFENKASGHRALLDDLGKEIDFKTLDKTALLFSILRWSALPGASRHHWGSDIDIYDANKKNLSDVELIPEEVNEGGPFSAMHDWLSERIASNQSFGFYRPYEHDVGGVAVERWHLSYAPVANGYEKSITKDLLLALFQHEKLCLLDEIQANFLEIFSKYVQISDENRPNWVLAL